MLILLFASAASAAGIFPDNKFQLVNKYATLEYFSRKHFEYVKVLNAWYNRTTRTFGCDFRSLVDVNEKWWFDCRIYQFRNNDYHPFLPMNIVVKAGDVMKLDYMGVGDIFRKNNVPFKLPIPPGRYVIKDIYADISKVPPVLLPGKYKVMTTIFDGKIPAVNLTWYGALFEKVKKKH